MISWSQNRAGAVVCVALLAAAPALANDGRRTAAPADDRCPCAAAARPRAPAPGLRRAALDQPAEEPRAPETEAAKEGGDSGDDDDAPMPLPSRLRHKRPAKAVSSEGSAAPLYILGGLSVVGVIGYGVLATWARDDNRRLGDCAPNCSLGSIAHIRSLYLAADISLGVGAAALVATTWLYVATRPTHREARYSWNLRLLPGGAVAGLGGAF